MPNATEQELPIGYVLTELAQPRGISGLEELAAAVNETTGKDYTAAELMDWPRPYYGADVDQVLHLTDEERLRVCAAWLARVYW
jgi:hypothetical protein